MKPAARNSPPIEPLRGVVTHEMGFARDVSDRVAYFHQGIIEEIDTPAEIFEHPKSEKLQKFLHSTR